MLNRKYGVVYTPDALADFVVDLLYQYTDMVDHPVILDPASGECSLLSAAKKRFGKEAVCFGIDIDAEAVKNTKAIFSIIHNDAITPVNVKRKTADYWIAKLPSVNAIIANPPWSTEKIYNRDKLIESGFTLINGQYDSYVLFIELAYNILSPGGSMAFIIPDSLFDAQNESLRRFLCTNTTICVIARLGEKIFDEVNRAATVIVCKKCSPDAGTNTLCFRLTTDMRKSFLSNQGKLIDFYMDSAHAVSQSRFLSNDACIFDVDTHSEEETLLKKITSSGESLSQKFIFGRGVEISKAGKIAYCPSCRCAQGYKKSHLQAGEKTCTACGATIPITADTTESVIKQVQEEGTVGIYVGENIRRYSLSGENYILPGINGIDYKEPNLYHPPKLLIRKTGLGIYCALDYSSSYTTQTVYILKYKNQAEIIPLEYYLAIINSRVIYYYYLKVYGENEWKSHPYLTKQIVFSLPIHPYMGDQTDNAIVRIATSLMREYDRANDLALEQLIMEKYGLTKEERKMIAAEMNRLPNLSAVNDMKMEAR